MFEKSTRLKFRFDTPQGKLTTEDLWDLPLTSNTGRANLDDIARGLNRLLKSTEDESFVTPAKTNDGTTKLKLEIVKHIIGVRMAENEEIAKRRENAAKKQQLLALIDQKKNAALSEMSIEELTKMVEGL